MCQDDSKTFDTGRSLDSDKQKNSDKAEKKGILESVCSRILPENSFDLKLFSIS